MAQPTRREWAVPHIPLQAEWRTEDFFDTVPTLSDPPEVPTDPRTLHEIQPRPFTPEDWEQMDRFHDLYDRDEMTGRSLRGSTRFSRDEVCRGFRRL